jgi:hypothetical protein
MSTQNNPRPPDTKAPLSEAARREKMREESRNFLWGMWLMLFLAISMGYDALQGMRSGKWVDLGRFDALPVPWWIAAALALCVAGLSVCCWVWHVQLKVQLRKQRPDVEDRAGG